MADSTTDQDIGTGLQTAAPLLSVVPYVGPLLSAAASVGGGFLKNSAAQQQAARAAQLRAQQVPLQPLRPEYQRKLNLDEQTAAMTIPGYQTAVNTLGASTAQNLRAIADRSPSGAATLSAMSNALYQKNQGIEKLNAANQDYRANALKTVSSDLDLIGGKERNLEVQQHADKALLNAGATNLENAATANKYGGLAQVVNSVGALGKLNAPNAANNNPNYMAYLKKQGYTLDAQGNIVRLPQSTIDNVTTADGVNGITSQQGDATISTDPTPIYTPSNTSANTYSPNDVMEGE